MLPFQPEPRERLEARFSLALTPTFNVLRCASGVGPFPGTQRRHVFDFENGMRMIVSVDSEDGGEDRKWLHFSFGMSPTCKVTGKQFIKFCEGVIKEFWKPDYVVIRRELTTHAAHLFVDMS